MRPLTEVGQPRGGSWESRILFWPFEMPLRNPNECERGRQVKSPFALWMVTVRLHQLGSELEKRRSLGPCLESWSNASCLVCLKHCLS